MLKGWGFLGAFLMAAVSGADVWSGDVQVGGASLTLIFRTAEGKPGATLDVPAQGAKGIPVDVFKFQNDRLTISIKLISATFQGDSNSSRSRIKGVFKQNGLDMPLILTKGEPAEKVLVRPQTPVPPFPYDTQDVSFANPNAEGVTLAGTLTKPKGEGPFPCVVMVTGSGPQDRDETLLGHKPFAVWADALAKKGIASLRYDDRGVAASKGSFATATTDDFASDARAAVQFLKTKPEIDPGKIGVMGHSEGGLIAPMVAADNPDVAFIVLLAGTAVPGKDIVVEQTRLIAEAEGAPAKDAAANSKSVAKLIDAVSGDFDMAQASKRAKEVLRREIAALPKEEQEKLGDIDKHVATQVATVVTPWMRRFFVLDPRESLAKVNVPVLAVWGSYDLQVPPAQNLPEARKALANNPKAQFHVFSMLNHLFQLSASGRPSLYQKIETTIEPEALSYVVDWIAKTAQGI